MLASVNVFAHLYLPHGVCSNLQTIRLVGWTSLFCCYGNRTKKTMFFLLLLYSLNLLLLTSEVFGTFFFFFGTFFIDKFSGVCKCF